ncbi:MAG: ABC transporter ATP-binding protein [Firmicutes bacterium]|nr:ABC transporter ATP-binding protein [Bacillota bacterium]
MAAAVSPAPAGEPLLTVKNISVAYGDVQALWDVSLHVQLGEVVALIGANGAGKTTTLKTISGLLRPRQGEVHFAGHPLHQMPAHQIVELGVAQVPEGRKLFPLMTVLENLQVGSQAPRARRHRTETLAHVMELFPRLAERKNQLAATLSGGEQQMVAIARGLMARPQLLILDEPSLGLAPVLVQEIFRTIRRIREEGTTVMVVEQNVVQTLAIADRAYVLENGRMALEGTGQELLGNEHVRKAYLGL